MKAFLSLFCLLYAVKGYTFANMTKLHKDLFTNYEKEFRPGDTQTLPTNLTFSFYMRNLKELQGNNGEMGIVGSLGVKWKDARLVWNPLDYGGDLNQTSLFVDDIWTPYMVLMNSYEEIRPILSGGFSCKIWYNGDVSCLPPPKIFEALCEADVTLYPYDTKICKLELYVSGYYSQDLKLNIGSLAFNRDMYKDTGPWDTTGTGIFLYSQQFDNTSIEILQLEIAMKRRSEILIWLISPILVITVMKLFVFLLPDDSGERVGFSLTILLAEILFLTLIQENLPEASGSYVPVLVIKLFFDTFNSFCILLGVIIASIRYDKTEENKKTEETQTTADIPDNDIVKTKKKILTGETFDRISGGTCLFIMVCTNLICIVLIILNLNK